MLRLLLDEHLSPALAAILRASIPAPTVLTLQEWDGGAYLQSADEDLLAAVHAHHLTLVTYDQRTIVPLLRLWGERARDHGGAILVDTQTLAPNDIGGLTRGLAGLWAAHGQLDWTNRVVYLTRGAVARG
jgi:hypothetical protein